MDFGIMKHWRLCLEAWIRHCRGRSVLDFFMKLTRIRIYERWLPMKDHWIYTTVLTSNLSASAMLLCIVACTNIPTQRDSDGKVYGKRSSECSYE